MFAVRVSSQLYYVLLHIAHYGASLPLVTHVYDLQDRTGQDRGGGGKQGREKCEEKYRRKERKEKQNTGEKEARERRRRFVPSGQRNLRRDRAPWIPARSDLSKSKKSGISTFGFQYLQPGRRW
jgi:hypothetical protein